METLQPGRTGRASVRVDESNTAAALGNEGVDVFATPFLVALMEEAAREAVEPQLPGDRITLGGWVEVKHLAPTPRGFRVEAVARLVEVKGSKLVFEVEVQDEAEVVARGRHVRLIAPAAAFFEQVGRKASAHGKKT